MSLINILYVSHKHTPEVNYNNFLQIRKKIIFVKELDRQYCAL